MATNRAFRVHRYGGADAMASDEVPVPALGRNQCLVQVKAVGANPLDWKLREGELSHIFTLRFPAVLGSEFSGVVIAAGEDVSRFAAGDRVMAMLGSGGGAFADTIAIDADALSAVPEGLSHVQAAALPVAALTGWTVLRAAGELRPGNAVLIHGAAGGVGSFAVQFAKAAGAKVCGTAAAADRDYVSALGADVVIDYERARFEDVLDDIDLVIDVVGGDTLERSWSVVAPGGAVVSIADPVGVRRAPAGVRGVWSSTAPDPGRLEEIAQDVAAGRLRSTIAEVFVKENLPAAIDRTQVRHRPGKIIVDFTQ